mgnify:CR=1 FL=1
MKPERILVIALLLALSLVTISIIDAAGSLVPNGDGTVTDTETGLVWQQENDGIRRTLSEASAYCSSLEWAGASDWRLPGVDLFMSIMDYSGSRPKVDPVFSLTCPGSGDEACDYWTSSRCDSMLGNNRIYYVDIRNGRVVNLDPFIFESEEYYVHCVRGSDPWPWPGERFRINQGAYTATDTYYDYMWQISGESELKDVSAAISYCSSLTLDGFNDWRLPTVQELSTVIHTDLFYVWDGIWSSSFSGSEVRPDGTLVRRYYYADYRYGCGNIFDLSSLGLQQVRCVRDVNGVDPDPVNQKPKAAFTHEPRLPVKQDAILFDAGASTDDGVIVRYKWDFGDRKQEEKSLPQVEHVYTKAGVYVVTLTVVDDGGLVDVISKTLHVKEGRVVLIHGLWDDGATCWERSGSNVKGYLEARNYYAYTVTFCPNNDSIETNAEKLAAQIKEVVPENTRASLVAHSMGGLAARYYLVHQELWPGDRSGHPEHRVNKLITLGTPHLGTDMHLLHPIASNYSERENHRCKQDECLHHYENYPALNFEIWSPGVRQMTAKWKPPEKWGLMSPMSNQERLLTPKIAQLLDPIPSGPDEWDKLYELFPPGPAFDQTAYDAHINYYCTMIGRLTNASNVSPFLSDLNSRPMATDVDYYLIYGTRRSVISSFNCQPELHEVRTLHADYGDGAVPPESARGDGLPWPKRRVIRDRLQAAHINLPAAAMNSGLLVKYLAARN